jgi:hypothetical protein
MKITKCSLSIVLVLSLASMAHAIQIYNFSSLPGASIQFNGTSSDFLFNSLADGTQWWITGESGQPGGSVLTLKGWFTGGPWSYGSISGVSDQSAPVSTSPAMLKIDDGTGTLATANVTWGVVSTSPTGGLNAGLTVNLFDLSYTGLNVDLRSFFSNPSGELNLSFQYDPAMSLTQLTQGSGPYTTSFSGTLTPVPEPGSVLLLGLGFFALLGRRALKR